MSAFHPPRDVRLSHKRRHARPGSQLTGGIALMTTRPLSIMFTREHVQVAT